MSPKEREHKPNQAENGTQFFRQIPGLVEKSIRGSAEKARRAQKQLIEGVAQQPYYDDVLITVAEIQQVMLNPHQNAQGIKRAAALLEDVLHSAGTNFPTGTREKIVRFSPLVIRTITEIEDVDRRLQAKPFIKNQLPANYGRTVNEDIPSFQESINRGGLSMGLAFALPSRPDEDLTKRDRERKTWNDWIDKYNSLRPKLLHTAATDVRDDLIDLLREEPVTTSFPERKFFTSRYAELSLTDIEKLPYPADIADLNRITDYLIAILKDNPSDLRQQFLQTLFFEQTFYYGIEGKVNPRNSNLLANLNLWQEHFAFCIVQEQTPNQERQTEELLRVIPEPLPYLVPQSIYQWTVNPLEKDPNFSGDIHASMPLHPLLHQAYRQYRQKHPGVILPEKSVDEMGEEYFRAVIFPLFQQRLEKFGVLAKYQPGIDGLNQSLQELPYGKIHLETVRELFELNCGPGFLARLARQEDEVRVITEEVWQAVRPVWQGMIEQGKVEYLPLQQGVDIVEFSEDSFPAMLGLNSAVFNTGGPTQQYRINLRLYFKNNYFAINGQLNQDGKLRLSAPFEQETPALYAMLNQIAVLAFHDLVIKAESMAKAGTKKAAGGQNGDKLLKRPLEHSPQSSVKSLPRKHRDRDLIETVAKRGGFKPRQVSIHRAYLPHAEAYGIALTLYKQALASHAAQQTEKTEEALNWTAQELLEAQRAFRYHPAQSKVDNRPPQYDLILVEDPFTGEQRYLKTWVIEHSSPKLTKEEQESPQTLYERRYRNSSALSFLDIYKPWIVGK